MKLEVTPDRLAEAAADWLLVPVVDAVPTSPRFAELDGLLGGQLTRLIEIGDLTGKLASLVHVRGVVGLGAPRVLLVGLGPLSGLTLAKLDRALASAFRTLTDKPGRRVQLVVPSVLTEELSPARFIEQAVIAAHLAGVGQDLFKAERGRYPLESLGVCLPVDSPGLTTAAVEAALSRGDHLGHSINLTRDLVNRPPQEITPVGFANRAEQVARELGLECRIWDRDRLAVERMQSLLAVAKGSSEPPRVVFIEYRGRGAGPWDAAFVGKGVTFDSGGLSLKPNDSMLTMKCDMAGAATVLGAIQAIAKQKLPINVLGAMGLVENMPGGNAFKLGDILTARNGVTIEVLNTDAEGRLVLADVLSYVSEQQPRRIVDLATLTGACVVALGEDVTGAFTNDDNFCEQLIAAGADAGEDLWRLPMFDLYNDLIKGDIGDIKNTGGRWGGAITAAKFLERFVDGLPWVHLDIAGPAFASSNKPYREAGATGCMVRTLFAVAERLAGEPTRD